MTRLAIPLLLAGIASAACAEKTVDEWLDELEARYLELGNYVANYRAIGSEGRVAELSIAEERGLGLAAVGMVHGGGSYVVWIDGTTPENREWFLGTRTKPVMVEGGADLLEHIGRYRPVLGPAAGDEKQEKRDLKQPVVEEEGPIPLRPYVTLGLEDLALGTSAGGQTVGTVAWTGREERVEMVEPGKDTVKFVFSDEEWMVFDARTGMLREHVIITEKGRRSVTLEGLELVEGAARYRKMFSLEASAKVERVPLGMITQVNGFHAVVFQFILHGAQKHSLTVPEVRKQMQGSRTWLHDYWRIVLRHSYDDDQRAAIDKSTKDLLEETYERDLAAQPQGSLKLPFAAWSLGGVPRQKEAVLAAFEVWRQGDVTAKRVNAALAPGIAKLPAEQQELGKAIEDGMLLALYEAFVDQCFEPFEKKKAKE